MRFFEIETSADKPSRHRLLAITELNIEEQRTPYITSGDRVLVPEAEIGELDSILIQDLTNRKFLMSKAEHILKKEAVIVHQPEGGGWSVNFDLDSIRSIRINELNKSYYEVITSRYPEWKQFNIEIDKQAALKWICHWTGQSELEVSTHFVVKLSLQEPDWRRRSYLLSKTMTTPVGDLVDKILARCSEENTPHRAQVERRVRECLFGIGLRIVIDDLRRNSEVVEREIRAINSLEDVIHFNAPVVSA